MLLAPETPLKAEQRKAGAIKEASLERCKTTPPDRGITTRWRPGGEGYTSKKAPSFERVWSQFYSNAGDRATGYFLFPTLKREERVLKHLRTFIKPVREDDTDTV